MALPLTYHWRNLFVRKTTTLLTVLVVAAVVSVLVWMLGFRTALKESLSVAAEQRKLIVLKRGATSESNSAIPVDDYNRLFQLTHIASDAQNGEPLVSPSMLVQVSLPRVRDGGKTTANVAVRGVTDTAFKVHSRIRPLGQIFSVGEPEVIVGVSAAQQFAGLNVGEVITLGYAGDRNYRVVGHFSADGGPMESEIWGYLPALMNAYHREMYSSATFLITDDADPAAVIEQIEGPSIQLTAWTEADYWAEQAGNIETYLTIVSVLIAVMCLAAVFSIANTMFSWVAGRTQEVAMLRTIGFSGRQVLVGFLLESILLSLIGGVLGCLACAAWLEWVGKTKDMFGRTTFTTLAFEIRLTPAIVIVALLSVTAIGVIGALLPAIRAARLKVITALREP
jgi:putative ABC transport system permease protein